MLRRIVASQLARPSGAIGPLMAPILNRGNRSINRVVVEHLRLEEDSSVLEVGFGGGSALAKVLERPGVSAGGVEVSGAMLAAGRRRLADEIAAGRLELEDASVDTLPFADDAFDEAFSVNTIYFWPDPDAGLREIARVLRPGGRVLLATFPAESMRRRSYTRTRFRFFDDDDLRRHLHDAGFVACTVERLGGYVISTAATPERLS